jgi:hypothetical protein
LLGKNTRNTIKNRAEIPLRASKSTALDINIDIITTKQIVVLYINGPGFAHRKILHALVSV